MRTPLHSLVRAGLVALLFLSATAGNAQNLVANGDFETGSFSGWSGEDLWATAVGVWPSGSTSYAAGFGNLSTQPVAHIWQDLETTGDSFFDIWLDIGTFDNPAAGNHIKVVFGDTVLLDQSFAEVFAPKPFTFLGVAGKGDLTRLDVYGYQDRGRIVVDNVVVAGSVGSVVPEAGSLALLLPGLLPLALLRRARKA